jgi:hypothetical protein
MYKNEHAGRVITGDFFLILPQDKGKHNLNSFQFWENWGRITDEGQESYPAILPKILPQELLRLWA